MLSKLFHKTNKQMAAQTENIVPLNATCKHFTATEFTYSNITHLALFAGAVLEKTLTYRLYLEVKKEVFELGFPLTNEPIATEVSLCNTSEKSGLQYTLQYLFPLFILSIFCTNI